jgi:O-antigen/teichoic acid export membrane protein
MKHRVRSYVFRLSLLAREAAPSRMLRSVGYLTAASCLNAGLGILFWVIAARRLDIGEVGSGAAAISLAALLANFSTLGMGLALTRHRHADPDKFASLLGGTLVMVSALSFLIAGGASLVLPILGHLLGGLPGLEPQWLMVGIIAGAWCGIMDALAIAEGDAKAVLLRNGVTNLVRLALLATVVADGTDLFATSAFALAISLPLAAWRRRNIVAHMVRIRPRVQLAFVRYALGHYAVTWIFNTPQYLVPVLTLAVLGPRVAGAVVLAWNGAFILSTVGDAAASALVAEGARDPKHVGAAHRRIAAIVGAVLLCLVPVALVAASFLPLVFGARFDETAVTAFRLFALASLPYLVVTTAVGRLRVEAAPGLILVIATTSGLLTCLLIVLLAGLGGAAPGWAYLLANLVAAIPAAWLVIRDRAPGVGKRATLVPRHEIDIPESVGVLK